MLYRSGNCKPTQKKFCGHLERKIIELVKSLGVHLDIKKIYF